MPYVNTAMDYVQEMAIALHLANRWVPATPHGLIVRRRIKQAIESYELQRQQPEQRSFNNRLMR